MSDSKSSEPFGLLDWKHQSKTYIDIYFPAAPSHDRWQTWKSNSWVCQTNWRRSTAPQSSQQPATQCKLLPTATPYPDVVQDISFVKSSCELYKTYKRMHRDYIVEHGIEKAIENQTFDLKDPWSFDVFFATLLVAMESPESELYDLLTCHRSEPWRNQVERLQAFLICWIGTAWILLSNPLVLWKNWSRTLFVPSIAYRSSKSKSRFI